VKGGGSNSKARRTVVAKLKIQVISYLYVNDTQEALISSVERAMIEYLNCDDGRVLHHTERWNRKLEAMIRIQEQNDGQITVLIPIGIESLLDYGRCVRLFRVDGDECEWVGKSEDIEFGQAIGRNN
jgi:hypothetical protein